MIHNLCTQLEFQGGARAIYLFELAMAKGEYRWGNDAKLVSAVAVAIAMTEEKKVDVIPRIAVSQIPSCLCGALISSSDLSEKPSLQSLGCGHRF
jgi:hypothetical protein